MLHFNSKTTLMSVELPAGTHNARPFRDGVLFNDSEADVLRYSGRGEGQEDRTLPVPQYKLAQLTHKNLDDQRVARQGFARGLCVLSERVVAGGSSPSTITVYDLKESRQLMSVNLTMDIRNAIHGLETWPYG
jgi:predicted lipase